MTSDGFKNDIGECTQQPQSICYHELTMNWDSILYKNDLKCTDKYFDDMDNTLVMEVLKKSNSKILAWPTMKMIADKKGESFPHLMYHHQELQKIQYEMMKGVTKEQMEEGPEEVFIDFSENPKGEYKYNVRDLTKTDEKIAQRLKPVTRDQLNVLRIFIDTISHQRFHRRFKQMLPWLKDHHWSQKKEYRVYEFIRAQSLAPFTGPNVFASYYGTLVTFSPDDDVEEPSKGSHDLRRYFKEAGYITGFVNDYCQVSPFFNSGTQFYDTEEGTYDHYFLSHACDQNIALPEKQEVLGFGKGIFTVGRHCIYGKEMVNIGFEQTQKFFETYRDKRKFMQININSAHSFYEKNSEFVDEQLYAFFVNFEKAGFLKDTIIHLYSDHGDHLHPIKYTKSGLIEQTHPFYMTILPGDAADKYHDNLVKNEQKLMTLYENFETNRRYTKIPLPVKEQLNPIYKAYSVFEDVLPVGRNCEELPVRLKEDCMCKKSWQ